MGSSKRLKRRAGLCALSLLFFEVGRVSVWLLRFSSPFSSFFGFSGFYPFLFVSGLHHLHPPIRIPSFLSCVTQMSPFSFSVVSFFPSLCGCVGRSVELQVACQSAVSQEQVEGMLSENEALRTNLAALEQVQLDECYPYSSVLSSRHPFPSTSQYDNADYSHNRAFTSCQNYSNYDMTAWRWCAELFISWGVREAELVTSWSKKWLVYTS